LTGISTKSAQTGKVGYLGVCESVKIQTSHSLVSPIHNVLLLLEGNFGLLVFHLFQQQQCKS
jgi:hypothetical protein